MEVLHVVGAAVIAEGRCLVAQRSSAMSAPGCWEFPGGKVEEGESPEEALARELREELGVEVEVGPFLGRGEAEGGRRRIVLDVYAATVLRGTPEAREHAALRWCGASELRELRWAEADVPVLASVIAKL